MKLRLFSVGDDQEIYAFAGALIRLVLQVDENYRAESEFLIENYCSPHHIIDAANITISAAEERMKVGHDVTVNR